MKVCRFSDKCQFVEVYKNFVPYELGHKGLCRLYCKKNRYEICIREQIGEEIGIEHIPDNMMPNGYHVPKTDMKPWTTEIYMILHRLLQLKE